jgi:hypothetical protein
MEILCLMEEKKTRMKKETSMTKQAEQWEQDPSLNSRITKELIHIYNSNNLAQIY